LLNSLSISRITGVPLASRFSGFVGKLTALRIPGLNFLNRKGK